MRPTSSSLLITRLHAPLDFRQDDLQLYSVTSSFFGLAGHGPNRGHQHVPMLILHHRNFLIQSNDDDHTFLVVALISPLSSYICSLKERSLHNNYVCVSLFYCTEIARRSNHINYADKVYISKNEMTVSHWTRGT